MNKYQYDEIISDIQTLKEISGGVREICAGYTGELGELESEVHNSWVWMLDNILNLIVRRAEIFEEKEKEQ